MNSIDLLRFNQIQLKKLIDLFIDDLLHYWFFRVIAFSYGNVCFHFYCVFGQMSVTHCLESFVPQRTISSTVSSREIGTITSFPIISGGKDGILDRSTTC